MRGQTALTIGMVLSSAEASPFRSWIAELRLPSCGYRRAAPAQRSGKRSPFPDGDRCSSSWYFMAKPELEGSGGKHSTEGQGETRGKAQAGAGRVLPCHCRKTTKRSTNKGGSCILTLSSS